MRRVRTILFFSALIWAPIVQGEPVADTPPIAAALDTQSLLRLFPAGGDPMSEKIAEALVREPENAPAVAQMSKGCNCEQATSIAVGVMRATEKLRQTNPAAIQPMYRSLVSSCSACRPRLVKGPQRDDDRCERPDAAQRQKMSDILKVRAPRGEDCFCSMMSSLAAQAFAQGAAANAQAMLNRFGFFPADASFGGGGVSLWPTPVTRH